MTLVEFISPLSRTYPVLGAGRHGLVHVCKLGIHPDHRDIALTDGPCLYGLPQVQREHEVQTGGTHSTWQEKHGKLPCPWWSVGEG